MSRSVSVGRSVLVSASFRNAAGELADPSAPAIRAKRNGVEQAPPVALAHEAGRQRRRRWSLLCGGEAGDGEGEWKFRGEAADSVPSPVSVITATADDF
jgi:hypothetical protein